MKNKRKHISILISIIIIIFLPVMSIYGNDKNYFFYNKQNQEDFTDLSEICLTPGETETMLNFCWYSKCSDKTSKVKIYENNKEVIYEGKSIKMKNGLISNKVTVENLKPNTTYTYSYECDGRWSEPLEYKTGDFKNYSFVFMGDPQIGASSKRMKSYEEGIKKDTYNWNNVIKKSLNRNPVPSFIICGGDETNTKEELENEYKMNICNMEYSGFLSPYYLRHIPVANAIGNHDKDNENFRNHFNMPNPSNMGETIAGGNYYFTYGNVLYLFINTNNLNIYEHEKFINDVVEENKDIKWKIAVFHHDIYGGGRHKDDEDIKILRKSIPTILEDNNINLVLCGHDHIYSRTYPLKNNEKEIDFITQKNMKSKDKVDIIKSNTGITYITGSSSTGSKFYKEVKDKKKYIKKMYNKEIPTYTLVNISENSIEILTYEINNNTLVDNKIIIEK